MLAWLAMRFGKVIARAMLVGGGLVLAGTVCLAMLSQAEANRHTAQAALVAIEGQAAATFANGLLVGLLAVVVVCSLVGCGYLALRWRLAERTQPALPRPRGRREVLPSPSEPAIYYVQEEGDPATLDLSQWGW
jgi:hypothetical protein